MEKIKVCLTRRTTEDPIRYQLMLTQEEISELSRIMTKNPQMDQMDSLHKAKSSLKKILNGVDLKIK